MHQGEPGVLTINIGGRLVSAIERWIDALIPQPGRVAAGPYSTLSVTFPNRFLSSSSSDGIERVAKLVGKVLGVEPRAEDLGALSGNKPGVHVVFWFGEEWFGEAKGSSFELHSKRPRPAEEMQGLQQSLDALIKRAP